MAIAKLIEARKLIEYINQDNEFRIIASNNCNYNNHIAALFTDAILQAGVNYKTVVSPRVIKVLRTYPTCCTVSSFCSLLEKESLESIISWKNEVKLRRLTDLLEFCKLHGIDTASELKVFLLHHDNKSAFLSIHGIGRKTYDYLLKLLNVDTVAVDRHIYSFLERAGIMVNDYDYAKSIVECAADLLGASRRSIDYSIWSFMAYEERKSSPQHAINFG